VSYKSVIQWLKKRRVAVLKGGWSRERSISLKTGQAVEKSFRRMGIRFKSIDVKPQAADQLTHNKIQFAFNALHGPFGEDGQIQTIMNILGIMYSGSGPKSSFAAMNKKISKELFAKHRVPAPSGISFHKADYLNSPLTYLQKIKKMLKRGPLFVKPVDQGSAIGITRLEKANQIDKALQSALAVSDGVMVEKLINGREITVGILGQLALPVTEIISAHRFYDFYSKYAKGGSSHITPAPIPAGARRLAQKLSKQAFRALGCTVYGRVDLMMSSPSRMVVLEVNTIPGMTNTSLLPEAAQAAGINFDQLVLKIVGLSIKK